MTAKQQVYNIPATPAVLLMLVHNKTQQVDEVTLKDILQINLKYFFDIKF